MTDPFTFDPARVIERPAHLAYPLPVGKPIGVVCLGERGYFEGYLKELFEKVVAGLSAHQKMAWLAAVRAEGVAP